MRSARRDCKRRKGVFLYKEKVVGCVEEIMLCLVVEIIVISFL